MKFREESFKKYQPPERIAIGCSALCWQKSFEKKTGEIRQVISSGVSDLMECRLEFPKESFQDVPRNRGRNRYGYF